MDIIYFSSQLKKERKKNNLTLTELADKSGVAKSAISYYENAEREPKLKTIDRLAKVLNVSSEELTVPLPNLLEYFEGKFEQYLNKKEKERDNLPKELRSITGRPSVNYEPYKKLLWELAIEDIKDKEPVIDNEEYSIKKNKMTEIWQEWEERFNFLFNFLDLGENSNQKLNYLTIYLYGALNEPIKNLNLLVTLTNDDTAKYTLNKLKEVQNDFWNITNQDNND